MNIIILTLYSGSHIVDSIVDISVDFVSVVILEWILYCGCYRVVIILLIIQCGYYTMDNTVFFSVDILWIIQGGYIILWTIQGGYYTVDNTVCILQCGYIILWIIQGGHYSVCLNCGFEFLQIYGYQVTLSCLCSIRQVTSRVTFLSASNDSMFK